MKKKGAFAVISSVALRRQSDSIQRLIAGMAMELFPVDSLAKLSSHGFFNNHQRRSSEPSGNESC